VETPEDILEEFGLAAPCETAEAPVPKPRRRGKARPAEEACAEPATSEFTLELQSASGSAFALRGKPASGSATLEIPAERTEMDGATLQSLLLQLELAGRIGALPGGRFTRLERRFFYVMLHSRQNLLLATPDKSLYEEDCKEPCPR